MKSIDKSFSLLALLALVLAPLARAEEPAAALTAPAGDHHRPDRADMRANRLSKLDEHLQLTDAQKQQIQAIWSQGEEQGKALRKDDSLSKEDRRAKMGDIMKATHDQVRAVLTPDQQKTFDAKQKGDRGHRGPRRGNGDKTKDAPSPKQ